MTHVAENKDERPLMIAGARKSPDEEVNWKRVMRDK